MLSQEIDKYYGVNETIGETNFKLGEAIKQVNWRITQNYKPQKRAGHNIFINYETIKDVQGIWHGTLGNKTVQISINNGKIYEYDMSKTTTKVKVSDLITDLVVKEVGTITDAKTSIFYVRGKLYFLNGTDYKEYDGTTYQDVQGYIPTIAISTPPAGGGTIYEQANLITGKKKQSFSGDGATKIFQLAETDVDSVDTVVVDGVTKTPTTDYTVSTTNGTVTFTTEPSNNTDNVVITWTKANNTNKNKILNCKYSKIFSNRVFVWGNSNYKNTLFRSEIDEDGFIRPDYFPINNNVEIGTSEFAITDIALQYDRQIIFTEHGSYYSYRESTYDDTGKEIVLFPIHELNSQVGNIAYGQVQLIDNSPFSLHAHSFYKWINTNVQDERNSQVISERIRNSLENLDLSTAVTFDNQTQKEYWCNVDDTVYIYNYGNDTFYMFDNISATCFADANGTIYYGANGTLEKFDGLNDNGNAIVAQLQLAFYDFGIMEIEKNSRNVYASIQPDSQTSLTIYYQTNRLTNLKVVSKKIEYILLDFNNIDFDNFSFLTNRNVQTFARKIRAKNYTYISYMIENKELNETCTLISLKIEAETGNTVS